MMNEFLDVFLFLYFNDNIVIYGDFLVSKLHPSPPVSQPPRLFAILGKSDQNLDQNRQMLSSIKCPHISLSFCILFLFLILI